MKRLSACVLSATLLIGGCDQASDFSKSGTMEEVARQNLEIEDLKLQIRRLKEDQEFQKGQDREWRDAAARDFDKLATQIANNAKVQNDNEKIDDQRWNVVRQRLGL